MLTSIGHDIIKVLDNLVEPTALSVCDTKFYKQFRLRYVEC